MSEETPPAAPRVRLLGAPAWHGPRHRLVPLPRKDAALFALLALADEPARDRVAAWLWPGVPLANARLNLRQRLHKLRQASGHPLVDAAERLRPLPDLDFDTARPLPDAAAAPLLGSLSFDDLPDFDRWLRTQRRRHFERVVDTLAARAAQAESEGALAAAIDSAQQAVAIAPWLEHAWRRLMRLHHRRGDRAAAVATFERFEREVCAEQGLRPSAETLQLLRAIEHDERPVPGATWLRPPRLVGRADALALLSAAWHEGRAVMVSGPGGIGKTRLLDEALAPLRASLRVRARPGDAASPYATAGALLQQVLDRFAPVIDETARAELARLLPALGPAAAADASQPRLWRAVDQLLQRACDQGLQALVVDDLHLADEATLDLLRWLLPEPSAQALRWGFGCRLDEPGPAAARLRDWAAESTRVQPLPLAPLDLAALRDLLQSLDVARPEADIEALAAALLRHAGGHPFFTLETLKALQHAHGQPGVWVDGAALPRPVAVTTLLQRRLQAVSPRAAQVLALAALAGDGWSVELAARALGCPPAELLPAWHELESAQVLGAQGFQHDLWRAAALSLLPQGARPALHAQLAQAYQALGGASPAALAQHLEQAGRWRDAATARADAAAAARRAGRLAEQQALLLQAAMAWQQAGEHDQAFHTRCDAAAVAGLLQGDAAALQALDALQAPGLLPEHQARLQALRAESLLNTSQLTQALQAAQAAWDHATPGSPVAADAAALLGRALALNGRGREGVGLLRQAQDEAAAAGQTLRERNAAAALAHALLALDERAAALHTLQRVVALAREDGDRTELAPHLANLATLALMVGDPERALPWALQAHRLLQAMNAGGAQARYNATLAARAAAATGDLALALDLLHAATAGGADATITSMTGIVHAGVLAALGRIDEALSRLPAVRDDVHPLASAGLLLAQARLLHMAGRDTAAPVARLLALDRAQPALFDEPTLCCEFGRWLPAAAAVARLARVHGTWRRRAGCAGMARGLAVRRVQRLLEIDPPAAAALAATLVRPLARGVHAGVYRPEAWWWLAQALRAHAPADAERCLDAARGWIAAARLPAGDTQARQRFEHDNPLNRRVLSPR